MATSDRRHLINVHSSNIDKVPGVDTNDMRYGELAVNHFKGKAFISTRVSDTEMELFPSVHYIEQYPFSSLTVNGLTTLSGTTKIEKIEAGDNTFDKALDSNSTNAVQNKVITKIIEDNEKIVSSALNDLNDRKLDATAYTPTDLSDYYKKEETSGKSDIDTALSLKANASDLTTHTSDSTIHITGDERTKWNDAATNSHTHANKSILDSINGIDTELSETSNNLVVNSAITKVIEDNEKISSAALNDLNERKLDASAYTPTDLSDYYKKDETSGKSDIDTALSLKANTSDLATKANTEDLTNHIGDKVAHITSDERNTWNGKISNAQYSSADKRINFYSGATSETPVSFIDATDFIQVETGTIDLSVYYKKSETSGSTQLSDAFNLKADKSDLTAHTNNSDIHITTEERTKWNNADSNSHTHANKETLDKITGIDTELIKTSNNLVVNSAITMAIQANKDAISTSFNNLDKKKLDATAYTPTDLSDYYKMEETSGKTQISTALNSKANASDLATHTENKTIHITSDERTNWNGKFSNVQYDSDKKRINFYSGTTTETPVAHINANDFIQQATGSIDLSKYYMKDETSGNTELTAAFGLKANASDLTTHTNNSDIHTTATDKSKWNKAVTDLSTHTGDRTIHITSDERTKWDGKISNVQYNKTDKKIYFYSGATTEAPMSSIDATDFIKDGMVSNVEIKDVASSGSCLVITFNADAGKQNIVIPVSKIFNPANYYLKAELDAALNSKANTSELSNYYKKTQTSGSSELNTAFGLKANATDLTAHTGNAKVHITDAERTKWNNATTTLTSHTGNSTVHITSDERTKWNGKISNARYNKTDKKIYFYSGTTTDTLVSSIDTTDFIKDGMVSNVEIKDVASSGSCLVITFNADAGKQNIVIPVSKIFNPANYYLKSELDAALNSKANTSALTAHTRDTTVHITAYERTNWNNAFTSRHMHSNKAVLDKITAIDTQLSETSNNLVVNSAITKVIQDIEETISASLNDLNKRIKLLEKEINTLKAKI